MGMLLSVLFFILFLNSQQQIILEPDKDYQNINSNIEYFEDPSGTLGIEEIRSPQYNDLFQTSGQSVLNFGRTSSSIWLRFTITAPKTETILLEQSKWYINYMDMYLFEDSILTSVSDNGSLRKLSEREIKTQNLLFKLNLKRGKSYSIFIKCQTQQVMELSLSLMTYDYFNSKEKSNHIIYGIFYGMIFLVIIYSLFFYFSLREVSYLYYIAYILFMALYFSNLSGISYEFLWPGSPIINFWSTTFTLGIGTCFVGLFTRKILNLKEHSVILDKLVLYSSFSALILSIGPFILPTKVAKGLTTYAIITPFISALFSGVYVYRKGYQPAKYYLISWILFLVGGIMFMLRAKQILPSNALTQNSAQFGAALQMILLSLSLNNRINLIRIEKEEALKQQLEQTKKNIALTNTFKKFVPQQFLELLGKKSITEIKLGDEIENEMTILFSDIRSFSNITQKLGARDSFKFINSYLEKMEPLLETNGGFIDKYIGDSIMALFPKRPDDALRAAINMQNYINMTNNDKGILGVNPVKIGVGINTGRMMLGTIGGPNRMESTVISDAVNIASQIEKRTKLFSSQILITESTYKKLEEKDKFYIRLIDRLTLEEKKSIIMLYEVFDSDQEEHKELKLQCKNKFEQAVKYYLQEEYLAAYELFTEYLDFVPNDRAAKIYIKRCNLHFERMD